MDWSDDVAYSVHDVEDAVASGRLDLRALRRPPEVDAVLAVAAGLYAAGPDRRRARRGARAAAGQRQPSPASYDGSRADLAALKDMTSRLIGRFVVGRRGGHPGRHGAGPLTRYARRPGRARRDPRRVRRAQGGRRPLRHARPRAGRRCMSGQREVVRRARRRLAASPGRGWTPTCAATATAPPTTPRRCASSSTRWPR